MERGQVIEIKVLSPLSFVKTKPRASLVTIRNGQTFTTDFSSYRSPDTDTKSNTNRTKVLSAYILISSNKKNANVKNLYDSILL